MAEKGAWKEGGAARNRTQDLWLTVPVLCHWATTPTSNHPSFMPLVAVGSCSSVAEHWHSKPKVLGSIPSSSTFLSSPFFSHSKGLWTVMASLRSLIRPSLISPQTKLIGVPTNGLPAVTTLKILLNQQSTRSYYPHSTVKTWLNSAVGCKPHKVLARGVDNIDIYW